MTEPKRVLTAADIPLPGGDFQLFVARLSLQGMLSLGLMENPLTGTKSVHLGNAEVMIHDLELLQEKTRGNLDAAEAAHLSQVLDVLQRQFDALSSANRET